MLTLNLARKTAFRQRLVNTTHHVCVFHISKYVFISSWQVAGWFSQPYAYLKWRDASRVFGSKEDDCGFNFHI